MATTTSDMKYTQRLVSLQNVWWKRALNVQLPYAWNLRRQKPGFTLEIGCGIGRNLQHLRGNGVGIDPNRYSVEVARQRGLKAFTPKTFEKSPYYLADTFDSILLSHVAEHMAADDAVKLIKNYLTHLRPGGKLILITPQEVGFRAEDSHVEFIDFEKQTAIAQALGLQPQKQFSFPFPRWAGNFFIYNEFVSVSTKPN